MRTPAGGPVTVLVDVSPAPVSPIPSGSFSVVATSATSAQLPARTVPIMSDGLSLALVMDNSADAVGVLQPGLSGAANVLMQLPSQAQVITVTGSNPPAVAAAAGGVQHALAGLDSLRAGGEPATAAALTLALRHLPVTGGPRVVMLFTAAPDAGGEAVADLAAQFADSGALLAVVSTALDDAYWSTVAARSGGVLVTALSGKLIDAFQTVAQALRSRYQLTFRPPERLPAQVSVRVADAGRTLSADVALPAAARTGAGVGRAHSVASRGSTSRWLLFGLVALVLLAGAVLPLRARIGTWSRTARSPAAPSREERASAVPSPERYEMSEGHAGPAVEALDDGVAKEPAKVQEETVERPAAEVSEQAEPAPPKAPMPELPVPELPVPEVLEPGLPMPELPVPEFADDDTIVMPAVGLPEQAEPGAAGVSVPQFSDDDTIVMPKVGLPDEVKPAVPEVSEPVESAEPAEAPAAEDSTVLPAVGAPQELPYPDERRERDQYKYADMEARITDVATAVATGKLDRPHAIAQIAIAAPGRIDLLDRLMSAEQRAAGVLLVDWPPVSTILELARAARKVMQGELVLFGPDGARVEQTAPVGADQSARTLLRLTRNGSWVCDCRTSDELARHLDLHSLMAGASGGQSSGGPPD